LDGFALSRVRLRSSCLVGASLQWFRPVGDTPFFYQKRKAAKKLTPDRFLIQIINGFYNAPALTAHPCAKRA